ncbi:MAG: DUF2023 family protein [Heliobacteriaceae bacterium]|jgi:hypothetical protein|nr:DUF2023 family protein [Heliobacteriaceae bacterium]
MNVHGIAYRPFQVVPRVHFASDSGAVSQENSDLRVFRHHIYEYKKGLRDLVLTTEKNQYRDIIENRLQKEEIPYLIRSAGGRTINVFFGDEDCIKVVKTFDEKLNKLSPEQDFMLGAMLGYDKLQQCRRYLQKLAASIQN